MDGVMISKSMLLCSDNCPCKQTDEYMIGHLQALVDSNHRHCSIVSFCLQCTTSAEKAFLTQSRTVPDTPHARNCCNDCPDIFAVQSWHGGGRGTKQNLLLKGRSRWADWVDWAYVEEKEGNSQGAWICQLLSVLTCLKRFSFQHFCASLQGALELWEGSQKSTLLIGSVSCKECLSSSSKSLKLDVVKGSVCHQG